MRLFQDVKIYTFKSLFYRWEKVGHVDRETWEKFGKAGLLGISVPTEHGGLGGDILMACIAFEEQ